MGILVYVLWLVGSLWEIVGTWRSASNHVERGGSRVWAMLAKGCLVLSILSLVKLTISTIVPQTVELTTIVAGDRRIPSYEIRVLATGNEVEFHGGLRAGSAKELERILNAAPQTKVLHVNSVGGRVHEAEKMARLVRERGLITYTSERCLSAATLVLISGKERVVSAGAKIGFHSPKFPAWTDAQRHAGYESSRQIMRVAGVSEEFINRVLATPSEDIWYPTVDEMQRAGVITSQTYGERFAASGLLLRSSPQDIDKALTKMPVYLAIKELEPSSYWKIINEYSAALESGRSETEARSIVREIVSQLMIKYLPAASDEALIAMRDVWVEMLKQFKDKDSRACLAIFCGKSAGSEHNVARLLSHWSGTERDLIVTEKILRTAAKGSPPLVNTKQADKDLAGIRSKLSLIYGDDLGLMANEDEWMQHSDRVCEMLFALYRETQKISKERQGNLLRHMLSGPGRSLLEQEQEPSRGFDPRLLEPVEPDRFDTPSEADYRLFRLKGISGPKNRRLAIINNLTFEVGEKVEMNTGGQTFRVHCVEIGDDCVIVNVNGQTQKLYFLR